MNIFSIIFKFIFIVIRRLLGIRVTRRKSASFTIPENVPEHDFLKESDQKRHIGESGLLRKYTVTEAEMDAEWKAACAVVALFAYVIRSDNGEIRGEEVAMAYEYFDKRYYSSYDLHRKLDRYLGGTTSPSCMDCALTVLKSKMPYGDRLELLESLFATAYDSEGVCDAEIQKLRFIAKYLVIKDWDLLSLEYKYEYRKMESGKSRTEEKEEESRKRVDYLGDSLTRHAYSVLGISSDATDEEVKTAYREIVKVCHPDKLTVPEGSKEWEESVVRFRQTNEAYELVCGKRGIA